MRRVYKKVTGNKNRPQINGVPLEDFLEFMDFLDVIWCGDTEEVTEIAAYACLNSAKLRSAVEKQRQSGKQTAFGEG